MVSISWYMGYLKGWLAGANREGTWRNCRTLQRNQLHPVEWVAGSENPQIGTEEAGCRLNHQARYLGSLQNWGPKHRHQMVGRLFQGHPQERPPNLWQQQLWGCVHRVHSIQTQPLHVCMLPRYRYLADF